ncbi:M1 family metallopeptidase [Nocardioides cavernaquae]|nr:M1 family metallopeptidase [Nocardioides cavernaquae]
MRSRVATAAAAAFVTLLAACTTAGEDASAQETPSPVNGAAGIGDRYFPADGNGGYDVTHYAINDTMRLRAGTLSGTTKITARATQDLASFSVDLLLTVTGVTVNGAAASYSRPNRHEVRIRPKSPIPAGKTFTVVVGHQGTPGSISWEGERSWFGNEREVVAINEPHIAPWWFAANDHPRDKATFDIAVRVRRGNQAISNGSLVSTTRTPNWTTYRWRMAQPMTTYLAFFAAGRFIVERGRTAHGTPYLIAVSQQLGDAQQRSALALMRRTSVVQGWLEDRLGTYPFPVTGGVVTSHRTGFALENQTRPVYPYLGSDADWLVAHELAHQWFGNSVTLESWKDIWLNEGLATYMETWWDNRREADQPAALQDWLEFQWETYANGSDFWQVKIGDPGTKSLFGDEVYQRGAMAVQALRHRIGETDFNAVLRTWVTRHRNGNAAIADFTALAEEISGEDLDGFFQHWLYDTQRPAHTEENGF